MSKYTYEFENRNERLETYEWDHVWLDHATTEGTPRVLYVGDSISCATRRVATAVAENTILFDGFGTSKALDNPYFADALSLFAKQEGERRVVMFNNGLHGWHLEDETEYAEGYERMIQFLLKEFEGTPVVLLLTTHVTNAERDQRVMARNRVVSALAEKYHLPVVDLYSLTLKHEDLLSPDGVHFTKPGYQVIADELIKTVRSLIE